MSENNHQKAAVEVWGALPQSSRKWIAKSDFCTAFILGRVSMKACFDKAELQTPLDKQENTTNTNERK